MDAVLSCFLPELTCKSSLIICIFITWQLGTCLVRDQTSLITDTLVDEHNILAAMEVVLSRFIFVTRFALTINVTYILLMYTFIVVGTVCVYGYKVLITLIRISSTQACVILDIFYNFRGLAVLWFACFPRRNYVFLLFITPPSISKFVYLVKLH